MKVELVTCWCDSYTVDGEGLGNFAMVSCGVVRPAKSKKFPTTGISRIEISPKRA